MARIGLVAGEGKLPIVFSKAAKIKGDTIIAFGLKGVTSEGLEECVDKIHWLNLGDFKKATLLLVTERIKKLILLGKIKKEIFFKDESRLDDESKRMLDKTRDKKDYSILNEVTNILKKLGIEVIDSTTYLEDFIPVKGVLTKREPTKYEWEDIEYGRLVGKELSGFDIGQTVVIKDKTVISIEAADGTDDTILRAGGLAKGDFTVVKVARPNQDMRFDVPLVGLETLKAIIKAGGKVLALEEKKTLLLDKDELIKLANESGISIVII